MKTSTLRHLVASLTDVRHYHLASALLETDPDRQSGEREEAFRVEAVIDAVRTELSIRDTRGVRTRAAVQRANERLERVLASFLDFGDAEAGMPAAKPSAATPPGPGAGSATAPAVPHPGEGAPHGHHGDAPHTGIDASGSDDIRRQPQPRRRVRAT